MQKKVLPMPLVNLIKIELNKLKRPQNILITILFLIFSAVITFVSFLPVSLSIKSGADTEISNVLLVHLKDLFLSGGIGSAFALIMIITTGREINQNTIRKSITDGMSRLSFCKSKSLLILLLALIIILFEILLYTAIALYNDISFSAIFGKMAPKNLLHIFIYMFSMGWFAFFLVSLLRKQAGSILLFIFYAFGEKFLIGLDKQLWKTGFNEYLPLQIIYQIMDNTFSLTEGVLLALLLFILIFVTGTLWLKRDL